MWSRQTVGVLPVIVAVNMLNILRIMAIVDMLNRFTREAISSLPIPDAKVHEVKSECLGQLIVNPEIVANKIKARRN